MDGIWIEVTLIGVAIIANGFFAGSELALVAARPSRLAELRGKGISGAAVAEALKREPERFLATIQIAITLVGTLASAVGGAAAVDALQPWLASLSVSGAQRWSGPVALGLVVLLITFFSLVLGELTPKALALRNPEAWAALVARPIAWLVRVLDAPGRTLTWATRIVLIVIGQRDTPPAPLVSEEEVKYLVREGASQGVFEAQESDLVHRVFQFTDTAVRHVMVPRPNIQALDLMTPPEEILKRAAELAHTRLPVHRGTLEETVGVVVIKDLFRCAAEGTTPVLERLVHAPIFVPETTQVSDVLRTFQRNRQHLALVVDEYGQVVGLVTTEDLLEEIVGEIRDEGESPRLESVTRLPDGSYIIDGTATIRDLREQVGLPLDDSPDYQTVAGFILNRLGVVPRPGATLHAAGHHWTVLDMEGPRIMKVKAETERA
ncbi:MAG: hemolysin family protein [Candidatus Rokuibacteriota bacterium]